MLMKSAKKLADIIFRKTKIGMILTMRPFIFEHPSDERFDEYPIKIFTSNKGTFACLNVSIKRNMDNTNEKSACIYHQI